MVETNPWSQIKSMTYFKLKREFKNRKKSGFLQIKIM